MLSKVTEIMEGLHRDHPSSMGRLYALITAFCMAFMTICMKLISKSVYFLTILPVQYCIGSAFSFGIYGLLGMSMYNPDKEISFKLFLRGLLGSLGYCFLNLAFRLLPPQKTIVLSNTLSIWVVVLSPFFLNEYPNRTVVAMLFVSLLGIVIMVDPSLILPDSWIADSSAPGMQNQDDYEWYYLFLPLFTAFTGAAINIFLKKYSQRLTHAQNTGYFYLFSSIYAGLGSLYTDIPSSGRYFSMFDLLAMTGVAISQTGFQAFNALAFKYERAGIVSLLLNSQIVMGFAMDYFFVGNKVEMVNIGGAALVILATSIIALSRDAPPPPPAPKDLPLDRDD